MRLGRVELKVLDLEKATEYYTNVIGMDEVGRSEGRVYLKAWDEYDHHSLILQQAQSTGMDHVAFKVESEDDLAKYEKKIEQFGCTIKRVSNRTRLGEGEAIRFELPTGHQTELYHYIEQAGTKVGVINPAPWPDNLRGISPHRIDHVALTGEDVNTVTRFFTEVLGLFQSEKIVERDGEIMIGSFLHARNGKPHDIAFVKGPDKKTHHTAFYVENWYDVLKAADICAKNNVHIEITPTRHGATRGQTTYFKDPSGNRNEAFTGGYITYPDFPTITWQDEGIIQGLFFHRRKMKEAFMKELT
jgi:catechol 2,3-dioxygenase